MTENHGYNTPEEGTVDWHIPLNENFERLDRDVEIRDTETERDVYEPKSGAKFFAVDTGSIFVGDGENWHRVSGGDSDGITKVNGINTEREHIGPCHAGEYHDSELTWGIHFAADPELHIESTVLDFDANNSVDNTVNVNLFESDVVNTGENNQPQPSTPDGMTVDEALVDSATVTLEDGPQRVTLGFQIPSNPETGEFFLGVDAGSDVYLRRIANWEGWNDYALNHIDLMFGGVYEDTTSGDFSKYYYRVFDIEIGDATTSVTSPWSHDIEEIYMRPRDPAEEFDDVSPRALWIDTS